MGSIHNELTGRAGNLSRAARNALQIDSAEVGIERLSETLYPTFNLWERPEWALLRGERLWSQTPSQPAVAAEFSCVGVFNPAGSNVITVVEEIWLCDHSGASPTDNIKIGANVAFTGTGFCMTRDTRVAVLNLGMTTQSFTHHSAAEIGFNVAQVRIADQAYSRIPLPIVLSPGFFCGICPQLVNQIMVATFVGHERPAFAGELTARA